MAANHLLKKNLNQNQKIMPNTRLGNNSKIISAYKKNPDLKDLLVRAQLRAPMSHTGLPKTPEWSKTQQLAQPTHYRETFHSTSPTAFT